MFSSTILDVAAGMFFVFAAVSLMASGILEAVSGFLTWRSGTLLKGIKQLLNDDQFNGLARDIYQHALINPRNDGAGATEAQLRKNAPAYIEPKQFADALIDILFPGVAAAKVNGDLPLIKAAIDAAIPNPQTNQLLQGIADRTNGNLNRMKEDIAGWFDNAMDRLSGYFKRWTLLWNFLIALALAGALNISTLEVAKTLWDHPSKSKVVENIAGKDTKDLPNATSAFQTLDKLALPIGWTDLNRPPLAQLVLGWLITAAATLFGAPFWFDLLQRVVRLKASGPSPKEKKEDRAAAS